MGKVADHAAREMCTGKSAFSIREVLTDGGEKSTVNWSKDVPRRAIKIAKTAVELS